MEIRKARATKCHIELNQDLVYLKITCGADTRQSNTKPATKKHKARVLLLRYGSPGRADANGHQPLNKLDVEDNLNLYPDNATE